MTLTQPQEALARAHEVRSKRGRIKQLLKERRLTLSQVLAADKVDLHTMKLTDLMRAVPGLREARMAKALRMTRIPPTVTLEGLSYEQRVLLIRWLRKNFPGVRV